MRAVTYPVERIVPISLMLKSGQLYHALRRYKWTTLPWEAEAQQKYRVQLAALFARFIARHGGCIADPGDGWDSIVVVPSTRTAPGQLHPLHHALSLARFIAPLLAAPLRASADTFEPHQADDGRFDVVEDATQALLAHVRVDLGRR